MTGIDTIDPTSYIPGMAMGRREDRALARTMVGAAFVDVVIVRSPLVIVPLLLLFVIATVWVMSE